jgi:hypothetical protein
MTKENVLKQLRRKRDEVYDPNCTDDSTLRLLYKVQRDAYDRCIKLVEQIT